MRILANPHPIIQIESLFTIPHPAFIAFSFNKIAHMNLHFPLAFLSNHLVPTPSSKSGFGCESKHTGVFRHTYKAEELDRHFQPFALWFYLGFRVCCAYLINLRPLLVMYDKCTALMPPLPSSSPTLAAEAVLEGTVSAGLGLLINSQQSWLSLNGRKSHERRKGRKWFPLQFDEVRTIPGPAMWAFLGR